ncbi:MAG: hypothetical protein RDV41_09350 [Planctomycetota bacterium]|nr:hypothetical protein [Planctomycetota bacterium]
MTARSFNYSDKWKDEALVCPRCGWRGRFEEGVVEYYETLMDCTCPACDASEAPKLAVVHFALLEPSKTRKGRAAGIRGTKQKRNTEREAIRLKSGEQLPELPQGRLRMKWDWEERGPGQYDTVIRCGDSVVWREPAVYEGSERFVEIVSILKNRYGDRLVDVEPTAASEYYLYGDRLSSVKTVDSVRAGLGMGRRKQGPGEGTEKRRTTFKRKP